jgi:flagellar motor switch protein FliN/FliY
VKVVNIKKLAESYDRPCVGVRVNYTEGIRGSNVLILKEHDVKIITSFMMGGDGVSDISDDLNDLHLSAIAEAMNQMIGSASTSLSSMIKIKIDIDTPHAFPLDFNDDSFISELNFDEEELVAITFRMEIGTLIDSEITQILPLTFALEMVEVMKNEMIGVSQAPQNTIAPKPAPAPAPQPQQQAAAPPPQPQYAPPPQYAPQPQYAPPPQYMPPPQPQYAPPPPSYQQPTQIAQPVQFDNFGAHLSAHHKENIDLIMDVPLEVTVELGRTTKKIKDILEFSPGSTIIELNKLAGEPIDVLVNGKFIAKGEVVVIDENFAVRITDIVSVDKRI